MEKAPLFFGLDVQTAILGALAWTGVGLFGNVTTRVARSLLRLAWPRRTRLAGARRLIYQNVLRTVPLFTGGIVGLLPGVWPEAVPLAWRVMLGASAGLFSLLIYHAIEGEVPLLAAAIPRRVRGWLTGKDDDDGSTA